MSSLIRLLRRVGLYRWWRQGALAAGVAALSACASQAPVQVTNNVVEAQHYAAQAQRHYTAPGSASDPWGPYIIEASARYDVPQSWIRGVIHQESSGLQFMADGTLTISDKGAMGLMQVMPETYDELRGRYGLGDDPYDPHSNILAGTAYLREMYDQYGMPAFLAAYNAGPGRLDKYLANTAALPDETRRYVAMIAPVIYHDRPASLSTGDELALNRVPMNIPGGLRYPRVYQLASRRGRHGEHARAYAAAKSRHGAGALYAALQTPQVERVTYQPASRIQATPQLAFAVPHARHGFHLISSAVAEPIPLRRGAGGSGGWAIQVGAYGNQGQAAVAAATARGLAGGHSAVGAVRQTRGMLYRARVTGMSRDAAFAACEKLHRGGCMVLSPAAQ